MAQMDSDLPYQSIYEGFKLYERQNQAAEVAFDDSQTVLFDLPLPDDLNIQPIPRPGEDKWDDDYVRMPTSPSSTYVEIDNDGKEHQLSRWDLIRKSLLEAPITNSHHIEQAIKKYNTKFERDWKFKMLHVVFTDDFSEESADFFFEKVMPNIIELALRLPELVKAPIPFLKKGANHSITLSQEQAGCLLANAFLCTFPKRNMERKKSDYPEINFNRLFDSNGPHIKEKIKCLLHYFKQICDVEMPTGTLTFQRRSIDKKDCPKWSESEEKFSSIRLAMSSEIKIEEGHDMLQVDFANRYLGGGVLGWGCVQEEIRFVINSEMIVGMLFCESMGAQEAIVMTGCQQFNKYEGYSKSFKWAGNFVDSTPRDKFRRKCTYVVAIDAISFTYKPYLQFEEKIVERELNKAFVGFYHDPSDSTVPIPVCGGNWGCGVYRGFKPLKALIQLMACCLNRRNLFYCAFGEAETVEQVTEMFDFLTKNDVTVGMMWSYLKSFKVNKETNKPKELYPWIYKQIKMEQLHEALDSMNSSHVDEKMEVEDESPPSTTLEEKPALECSGSKAEDADKSNFASGTSSPQKPPPKRLKRDEESSPSSKAVQEESNTEQVAKLKTEADTKQKKSKITEYFFKSIE